MAQNQDENKEVDADLEKARKSMGDRVDPDPEQDDESDSDDTQTTPPVTPDPNKEDSQEDMTPESDDDPEGDKKPDGDDSEKKDEDLPDNSSKRIDRPQAYIPMPKYLSEKKENERILADKEAQLAEALKKVEDLTSIAKQNDGAKKDDDIQEFMDNTGFSRETVEGLLKLASKRLLDPEKMKALETATNVVKEAEIEAAFNTEFEKVGQPELKKAFPNITEEQMEKAKSLIDQVAHAPGFNDKPLDFIIYKHRSEIEKLMGDAPENKEPPKNKKTIEGSHPGQGKITGLTAKDFEGKTDFSELKDMEPAARNLLIKDFSVKTYENFKSWVNDQDKQGTEVMRDGKRVLLK